MPEDKNRQLAAVELANRPHEVHSSGMRQAKIEDNEIDAREIGAHAGEQLHGALDGERGVTGAEQRRSRSRTKAVSSATMTVLLVVTAVAVTLGGIGRRDFGR